MVGCATAPPPTSSASASGAEGAGRNPSLPFRRPYSFSARRVNGKSEIRGPKSEGNPKARNPKSEGPLGRTVNPARFDKPSPRANAKHRWLWPRPEDFSRPPACGLRISDFSFRISRREPPRRDAPLCRRTPEDDFVKRRGSVPRPPRKPLASLLNPGKNILMTRDQIQAAIARGVPFTLRMADGKEYPCRTRITSRCRPEPPT